MSAAATAATSAGLAAARATASNRYTANETAERSRQHAPSRWHRCCEPPYASGTRADADDPAPRGCTHAGRPCAGGGNVATATLTRGAHRRRPIAQPTLTCAACLADGLSSGASRAAGTGMSGPRDDEGQQDEHQHGDADQYDDERRGGLIPTIVWHSGEALLSRLRRGLEMCFASALETVKGE